MPLDSPGEYPPRQDPYPCRAPPFAEALAALLVQLGAAADLEPARSPGIHPLEIVDDESHARVGLQVPPLLRAFERMPADFDRLILGAQAKSDRDDVRRAVAADGRQAAERLSAQVLDLLLREDALLSRAVLGRSCPCLPDGRVVGTPRSEPKCFGRR